MRIRMMLNKAEFLAAVVFFLAATAGAARPAPEEGETVADFYQAMIVRLGEEGAGAIKCGFPYILQAAAGLPEELENGFKKATVMRDDLDQLYISPSGHFHIRYSLSGFDAIQTYDRDSNGIPDYLEFVGNSFDRAWEIEINQLGFDRPPDIQGQPRNVYQVECRRLSVYGTTFWDPDTGEIASLPGLNYVTTIEINTDFSNIVTYPGVTDPIVRDSMAIAVTAAHEFNHASQTGYRLYGDNQGSFLDLWFIESTATYMEEVVAPEVNDYLQYLSSYFRHTDKPLDRSDRFSADYGKVVFFIMLGEKYGKNITRRMWEEVRNDRATPSISVVLNQENTGFKKMLTDLSAWIFYSGSRTVGMDYFPDAILFPPLGFEPAQQIREQSAVLVADSLPRLAFDWFQTEVLIPQQADLLLKAAGGSSAKDQLLIISDGTPAFLQIVPASLVVELPVFSTGDSLYFSVVNGQLTGESFNSFSVNSRTEGKLADIYPQPLKLSQEIPFLHFNNLPANAVVHIFSANGRHLQELHPPVGGASVSWDLNTQFGKLVGSGVYIYFVKSDAGTKTGKFVVLR